MERPITGNLSVEKEEKGTSKPSTLSPAWEKLKKWAEDLIVVVFYAWSREKLKGNRLPMA